jgi:hypothetical protein
MKAKAKANRVKEHPYNDVTADWLRVDENALEKLRQLQERANKEARKIALWNAEAWLNYCREHAPKGVIAQAERNYNIAKARV